MTTKDSSIKTPSIKKQSTKKHIIIVILIYISNLLVLLGYILLFPFEKIIYFLLSVFTNIFALIKLIFTWGKIFVASCLLKVISLVSAIKLLKISATLKRFLPVKIFNFSNLKPVKEVKPLKSTKNPVKTLKNNSFDAFVYGKHSRLANFFAFCMGVGFTLFFVFVPYTFFQWFKSLPQPGLLLEEGTNKSTRILDKNGRLLYEIFVDKRYTPLPLNEIPLVVKNATLAAEDASFYNHYGFRITSIIRAVKANISSEDLQGGSTITQQLVKNLLLSSERTYTRKIKELILSVMVEQKYTKDQIFELYLNNVPYGGTSYGIESASQKFFGKSVKDLNLAEAALLAGLPSAPSIYSPFSGGAVLAKERQRYVLDRMVEEGFVDKKSADEAFELELKYAPQIEYIRAPHFVNYIRDELNKIYGKRMVDFGGLTVTTTLDLDIQEKVQAIVAEEVTKNEYLNLSNGAAVVVDPNSGGVLAYVGSREFFSDKIDGKYDVARAFRQPGSSVKPITYALAFENGATPATIISDTATTFKVEGGPGYTPKNYDGKFHGNVTLRTALANSYNIPPVKLLEKYGTDKMVTLSKNLGLRNWSIGNDYGLSITLGGKEVRLLDHVNVFATFARGGIYKDLNPFVSVKDINGFDITVANNFSERVLSKESAYLIAHILSDNIARLPAFGYNNSLSVKGHTIAVKTGTTDAGRDNWTMGFTPNYAVGVWVGNNNNQPMNRYLSSGLTGAAPIWNRIYQVLLEGKEDTAFPVPDGIIFKVDPGCGNAYEVFAKGSNIPSRLCAPKEEKKDNDKKDKDKDD